MKITMIRCIQELSFKLNERKLRKGHEYMCGICGFINNNSHNKDVIIKMNKSISHRCPDDEGYYIDSDVAFGQKRLSILDLSEDGHQPMLDNENRFVISFNGEIYNFQEIKDELISMKYTFRTKTDTEVILYAYKEWGINCVEKFIGMFAIALWDKIDKKLVLIRDRVGIKPLYYYHSQNSFVFGSELKPIMTYPEFNREINLKALPMYLTFGYIPSPYSIFVDTYKLEPGKYLVYENNSVKISTYWDNHVHAKTAEKSNSSESELLNQLDSILRDSIKKRMISDVPLGAFLSGGIDSSLVVSIMQDLKKDKIKTFSIGFDNDKYNEAPFAKEIAEFIGTEHTELYIGENDLLELVDDLVNYFDEPFSDSSAIPTMLVSKLAKESVTVVLSGDGGDELFSGYKSYSYIKLLYKFHKLPKNLRRIIGMIGSVYNKKLYSVLNYDGEMSEMILNLKRIHSQKSIESIMIEPTNIDRNLMFFKPFDDDKNLNIVEKDMISDFNQYMVDDVLTKVDRASMKYGLEVRVPILDHRLVEFTHTIPLDLKLRGKESKYLLKQLLYRYIPKRLVDRPKKGFSVPIEDWINGPLYDDVKKYLGKDYISTQGIFNYSSLSKAIEKNDLNSAQIWNIYIFQKWYDEYIAI